MVGVDIVSLKKIKLALLETPQIIDIILHKNEKKSSVDPQFIAGRFAGKEALLKMGCAISTPLLFSKVELIPEESKGIIVKINEIQCDIGVSISHDEDYVVAVAVNSKVNNCKYGKCETIHSSERHDNQEVEYVE